MLMPTVVKNHPHNPTAHHWKSTQYSPIAYNIVTDMLIYVKKRGDAICYKYMQTTTCSTVDPIFQELTGGGKKQCTHITEVGYWFYLSPSLVDSKQKWGQVVHKRPVKQLHWVVGCVKYIEVRSVWYSQPASGVCCKQPFNSMLAMLAWKEWWGYLGCR